MSYPNVGQLNTFTKAKVIPIVANQWARSHPFLRLLKENMKTYNTRQIELPVEYGNQYDNISFPGRLGSVSFSVAEFTDKAYYNPHTMTGTIKIPLDDILDQGDKGEVVIPTIKAHTKNMTKSLDLRTVRRLWERGTTGSDMWSSVEDLVSTGNTCGGIDGATYDWWNAKVLDTASGFTYDATDEDHLLDPSSDVYILKLRQRAFAKAKYLTGEKPTHSFMPQYLFDMIESILDPNKTGSKMDEKMGEWGFDSIKYRGVTQMPDEDMVAAQVDSNGDRYSDGTAKDEDGNTITASSAGDITEINGDGRINDFNMNYMYMFMNAKAKFSLDPGGWRYTDDYNSLITKLHARGNIVTSCRAANVVTKGVRSPYDYSL